MPEDADRWPLERLRIVLLHELAHVKRRDCLTHVLAQLACALHWFNPLAWMAARHIRTERERACDDLVLACGTRGSGLRGGAAGDRPRHARRTLPGAAGRRDARHGAPLAARGPVDRDPRPEGPALWRLAGSARRSRRQRVACALPPLAAIQPWTVTQRRPRRCRIPRSDRRERRRPQPTPRQAAAAARSLSRVRRRRRRRRPELAPADGVGDRAGHRGRDQRGSQRARRAPFRARSQGAVAGRDRRPDVQARAGRTSSKAHPRRRSGRRTGRRGATPSTQEAKARRRPIPARSRR